MEFFTLNQCCFMSLPTAGVVIGLLGSVIPLLETISCISHLYYLEESKEIEGYYDRKRIDILYMLVPSIVYLITSVLLIIGIKKKTHLLLLPWLAINVIALALAVPFALAFFYFAGVRGSLKDRFEILSVYGLVFGIFFWMWLAVFSLFRKIRNSRNNPSSTNNEKNVIFDNTPRYEIVQLNA